MLLLCCKILSLSTVSSNLFTNLVVTSVQQTFLHFWSSHYTTSSFYPFHLQLSLPSNSSRLKISDIFLLLSSCSLECSTTPSSLSFSVIFSKPFSSLTIIHNFTSSWKLTLFFIPFLLSLYLYWADPLKLWSGLFMWFIIHFTSFICSTRYHLIFSKRVGISWHKFIEFLSALWCTRNLPHIITFFISHFHTSSHPLFVTRVIPCEITQWYPPHHLRFCLNNYHMCKDIWLGKFQVSACKHAVKC